MSAPSPGIVAMAVRNEHYDTLEAYLAALGARAQGRVRGDRAARVPAADRRAGSRARTPHHLQGAAGRAFVGFRGAGGAAINRALANIPRDRVRLHVCWGNSESPHDCDVPLDDILPTLQQANVGGFVLPFANPRHAHEFRCFEKHAARRRPDPGRGRDRQPDQFRRASRGGGGPPRAGRSRRRRSRRACSPAPTAASTLRPAGAASPRTWCGRSSRACATAPASRRSGCSNRA